MDPNSIKVNKTGKSAIGLLLVVVVIAAVIAAFILIPDLAKNTLYAVIIIVVALAIIAGIIWLVSVVLAVPYYAAKGESYQDDMSYNMDDVKSVKETSSDDKKE